jgi:hypothetical protein
LPGLGHRRALLGGGRFSNAGRRRCTHLSGAGALGRVAIGRGTVGCTVGAQDEAAGPGGAVRCAAGEGKGRRSGGGGDRAGPGQVRLEGAPRDLEQGHFRLCTPPPPPQKQWGAGAHQKGSTANGPFFDSMRPSLALCHPHLCGGRTLRASLRSNVACLASNSRCAVGPAAAAAAAVLRPKRPPKCASPNDVSRTNVESAPASPPVGSPAATGSPAGAF